MISFESIPELMKTNGEKLAEATAHYEFLDNMLKTVLANCCPLEWTEAFKEREWRKHVDYLAHLEGLREARKDMLVARTYQDALQARFDYYRTVNANRRSEINLV